MIEDKLTQLGLSDKEITIYVAVLEAGKLSAQQIASTTNINRTTVYSVLKELIKKNLIIEDITETTRYYSPENIDNLREIYKKEEKVVLQKKEIIESLVKELEVLPKSKNYSVPKIRFIEESQLNDFLHKNLSKWLESAKGKDTNWWGFQDATFIDHFPEWIKYHWEVMPDNYGMKVFANKKPSEKRIDEQKISNREVKYWQGSEEFTATHAVMGDYVLFIMTRQHPFYAVETHDVVMADNLRKMFKAMWKKF
jgi:sugar-specific transcriptional regulator TrmB